jgi:small conductance mechanosensitive channel
VVWYVRNGEILRVANRSQGWTMAVVDVPINYDSDLDQVRALVEQVANQMMSDPTCEELIIDRPEYAGVESVSGEAMVIRITARALPDKQVPASREIRERLKIAFDAAGVKVPVVLRLPNTPPKA